MSPQAKANWIFDVTHDLTTAIEQFGLHTFFDKGPHEVMDVGVHANVLRELDGDVAGDWLQTLWETGGQKGKDVASAILGELDNMPQEWWDACCEVASSVP